MIVKVTNVGSAVWSVENRIIGRNICTEGTVWKT